MKTPITRLSFFIFIFIVVQFIFPLIGMPAEVQLYEGWNLIGLSEQPIEPYTAATLTSEINAQGGSAQEVDRWYSSGWDSYITGLPFNEFPIETDQGYFIRCDSASTWTYSGTALNLASINFGVGWTLISLPTSTYLAQSLLNDINSQSGDALEIARWYNAGWDSHINGLPFNDFNIDADKGYFVRCNIASTLSLGGAEIQPPTGLAAAAGDTLVDLSWTQNTEPNLAGYNVYRSETQGGPYTQINVGIVETNAYQDTSLTNGTTYYYVVTAVDTLSAKSAYSDEVSATPQAASTDPYEPNNEFSDASEIALNTVINTATYYPNGDIDWYKFNVTSTGVFTFSLTNVPSEMNPYLQFYDSNQNWVESNITGGGQGQDAALTAEISSTGYYYVSLQDMMGMGASTAPYSFQASVTSSTDPYEPNNTFSTAANLDIDTVVTADLFPTYDLDWFKITVDTTGMLIVQMYDVPANITPMLELYDSDQMWIPYTIQGTGEAGQPVTLMSEITETGTYYLLIQDMMGGYSVSTYSLKAMIKQLWVENFSHSPDMISPNADGIKDLTAIEATLSKTANWTITIKNSSNATVRTFTDLISANINQAWDGKDETNTVVPDGTYTYTIDAYDPITESSAEPVSGTIKVDTVAPVAIISSPSENDTLSGTVTITGTATDDNFGWNSYLYYGQGTSPVIWEWIQNLWQEVTDDMLGEWDTTMLSNGDFVIRLELTDNAGNKTTTDVPVKVYNLIISNAFAMPNPFSPNNDGNKDTTIITANITGSADWTITIKDSSNTLVKTLTGTGSAISRAWDGKDETSTVVPDGNYTYYINAVDPETGATSNQVAGFLEIDNTPPIAEITSPASGEEVGGTIDIIGTVDDLYFGWQSYLYYGEGTAPSEWVEIQNLWGTVINDTLASWDTTQVTNGAYILRLDLTDFTGNRTITDVPISIYNLVINNPSANPNPFSPNNNGVEDYTLITASVPCNVNWTIDIKNSSDVLIKSIAGTGKIINYQWDGKDSSNILAADGTYTYYINAHDPITEQDAPQVSGSVDLDNTPPAASITHPLPYEVIGGTYDITGIADDVHFASYTGAGNQSYLAYGEGTDPGNWYYLENISSAITEESIIYSWDISYLNSGPYTLHLNVADHAENVSVVTVPVNICKVNDFYAAVNPFSPNNDNIKDTTSIIAVFSQTVNWTITIKTSSSTTVRTFTGTGNIIAQVWDGKNESSAVVSDGTYTYYISAVNPSTGSSVFTGSSTVDVDTLPPTTQIITPLPDATITETINIFGICTDSNYDGENSYVSYGVGASPSEWFNIGYIETPVSPASNIIGWYTGQLVNGIYTIRLISTDQAGNTSQDTVQINTYNVKILSCSAVPNPFSPDNDGQKDTTTISAELTMNLDWTMNIYNNENTLVKTFNGINENPISQVWDGTDESLTVVPDGSFNYQLTVTDPLTMNNDSFFDSIIVDKDAPVAEITSPADSAVVYGSVPIIGTAQDGNFEAYILEAGSGDNPAVWNNITMNYCPVTDDLLGTWETLNLNLENGTYTIRLTVSDKVGHTSVTSKTVTLDNIAITGVSIDPPAFMPSQAENVTIYYTISKNADITIKIYDLENNLIKTLLNAAGRSAGQNSEVWDGTNSEGSVVADGGYNFTIEADVGRGWYQCPQEHFRNWGSVSNFKATQKFNPFKSEPCEITFTLEENSLFTLGIGQNENFNSYFWYFAEKPLAEGEHRFIWDGRDRNGEILDYATEEFGVVIVYDSFTLPENTIIAKSPEPPQIQVSSDSYSIIVWYGETTEIKYTVPVDGNVTVTIYDPPNILIKTLVDNEFKTAGTYTLNWNGTDHTGKLVSNDADYIINVSQAAGDGTITRNGNISVGYIVRQLVDPI